MPVPILSNHRMNKARLTHGKYLARYVEEQCLNLAIKPTVLLNLVANCKCVFARRNFFQSKCISI